MDANFESRFLALLTDIRSLLRVSVSAQLKELSEQAFPDERQKKAYALLWEEKSLREVAGEVSVGVSTIHRWVIGWRDLGLVEEGETKGNLSPRTFRIGAE